MQLPDYQRMRELPPPRQELTALSDALPVAGSDAGIRQPIPPLQKQGYTIMSLLFFVSALCALDRVAMSVAILPMADEFDYSESTKGAISSIFSIGYMVGLIPSGLLGTFSSPKNTLSYGVLLWSAAQIATPFAAYVSFPALYASRFCMGLAEAVAIPTVQTFVARWVPEYQRSLVLGLVLSGLQVGNVLAYLVSPAILDAFNWNGLFLAYGAIGFLWVAFWVPFAKDNPSSPLDCFPGDCSVEEMIEQQELQKQSIDTGTLAGFVDGMKEKLDVVPWKDIMSAKPVRAIAVAHAVQNVGLYINLAWLPTYFNQQYDLSVGDSSFSAVLPWIAGAFVSTGAGYAADRAMKSGWDKTIVRKVIQTLAMTFPAISLLALSSGTYDAQTAIGFFIVAIASASACVAGYGASVQDVCNNPKLASTLYGITSTPAVLLGSLGVFLTGVVLDATDQNWDLVFKGLAVLYFFGAAYYAANYEAKKMF